MKSKSWRVSEHCIERLKQRYNINNPNIQDIISNILLKRDFTTVSEINKSEAVVHIILYKKDVQIIIQHKTRVVITATPLNFQIDETGYKQWLKDSLDRFVKEEITVVKEAQRIYDKEFKKILRLKEDGIKRVLKMQEYYLRIKIEFIHCLNKIFGWR